MMMRSRWTCKHQPVWLMDRVICVAYEYACRLRLYWSMAHVGGIYQSDADMTVSSLDGKITRIHTIAWFAPTTHLASACFFVVTISRIHVVVLHAVCVNKSIIMHTKRWQIMLVNRDVRFSNMINDSQTAFAYAVSCERTGCMCVCRSHWPVYFVLPMREHFAVCCALIWILKCSA